MRRGRRKEAEGERKNGRKEQEFKARHLTVQYTAYIAGNLRVIADQTGFTLQIVAIKVDNGLQLAVDVRVRVRGHHFVLSLQQSNGSLSKGLAQWLLEMRGRKRMDCK